MVSTDLIGQWPLLFMLTNPSGSRYAPESQVLEKTKTQLVLVSALIYIRVLVS